MDPNLTTPTLPLPGLADLEGDQQASPGNSFTYKLDLSQCYLAAHGTAFAPGDEVPIAFRTVSGGNDTAHQTAFFKGQ
jgi:hypothetical protein